LEKIRFKVIDDRYQDKFTKKVNEALNDGYELHGSMTVLKIFEPSQRVSKSGDFHYYQPVILCKELEIISRVYLKAQEEAGVEAKRLAEHDNMMKRNKEEIVKLKNEIYHHESSIKKKDKKLEEYEKIISNHESEIEQSEGIMEKRESSGYGIDFIDDLNDIDAET